MSDREWIMEDPETGGRKGMKESQLGFIDPKALYDLGRVAGFGTQKYDKWNYLKGYDYSLSFNAAMRHMLQFWDGEDYDEESSYLHVLHAAWHMLALASFITKEIGNDDRFKAL